MKRLLVVCSLVVVPMMLLAGCGQSSNGDKKNKMEHKGNMKMARKKTDSGLEYEVIKEGSQASPSAMPGKQGVSPQIGQMVTVHYTGWLDNNGEPGAKFDSSVDRGQPFTFSIGVGQVIKGWDEGVMAMKVGEKRRLIIPANLGYGSQGAGSIIPPHATLIFDVELLKVS